ncbi:uncharacterized protein LOC125376042 isoform X2 [Haliotis rufescens]|uniref:uncharacterized protein LOC125376042 isoform X2 n=1 Tax=Haliotis rufescens TaxID=6454 RepID=UPI00201F3E8B|nr:uncharacterized protein LOC125376042 isoform X2 [Haliotis rufescens]
MLQEYDFEIIHRPGKANTNADALSHIPHAEQVHQPNTDDIPSPPISTEPISSTRTYAQVAATASSPLLPTPTSHLMSPSSSPKVSFPHHQGNTRPTPSTATSHHYANPNTGNMRFTPSTATSRHYANPNAGNMRSTPSTATSHHYANANTGNKRSTPSTAHSSHYANPNTGNKRSTPSTAHSCHYANPNAGNKRPTPSTASSLQHANSHSANKRSTPSTSFTRQYAYSKAGNMRSTPSTALSHKPASHAHPSPMPPTDKKTNKSVTIATKSSNNSVHTKLPFMSRPSSQLRSSSSSTKSCSSPQNNFPKHTNIDNDTLDSHSVSSEDISRDDITSSISVDFVYKSCPHDPPSGPMVFAIGTDLDDKDLAEKQRKSPDLCPIMDYIEKGEIPSTYTDVQVKGLTGLAQEYDIRDGILYHFYHAKHRGQKNNRPPMVTQLAVPVCCRKELLFAYHDSKAGGCHFGRDATRQTILTKYYWPGLYQDIENYVKSCDDCQRSKRRTNAKPAPMVPMPIEDTFSRLHVDILGPLPETKEGYKYVLLAVDSFSRWTEGFLMRTQEASEVASILFTEVFSRFGAPRTLLTDRGRQFTSKLVNALCELLDIKHYYTSSYHPQTNGMCERRNSVIEQALRTYADPDQTNWAKLIPCVMMAMRNVPCQSTGYSPHYLLFGKEMNLPFDTTLLPKSTLGKDAQGHLQDLLKNLNVAKSLAKDNMSAAQDKSMNLQDVRAKEPSFAVGDQVLMTDPTVKTGLSPKLSKKWIGPYRIIRIGLNYTFKLLNTNTNKEHKSFIHANRLKTYTPPTPRRQTAQPAQHLATPTQSTASQPDNPRREALQTAQHQSPPTQSTSSHPDNPTTTQHTSVEHPIMLPHSSDNSDTIPQSPTSSAQPDDQLYAVKRIHKAKKKSGVTHYLIEWEGYPHLGTCLQP